MPHKLLRVNLSTGKINREEIPTAFARDYIGGWGLAVRLLSAELDPKVDPMEPANKLTLGAGTMAATNAQSVSRWIEVTGSPQTSLCAISCRSSSGALTRASTKSPHGSRCPVNRFMKRA